MVESTGGAALGGDGEASERPEPPTTLMAASGAMPEPPTKPMVVERPANDGEDAPAPVERAESVWPGLTAAGLPTRVPRERDEDEIREAFAQSWEAGSTSPTPLTRKPFTPTYLTEPPRQRTWPDDIDPVTLLRPDVSAPGGPAPSHPAPPGSALDGSVPDPKEPPEPREPPEPKEPPEPRRPPEPKEPPHPPPPPGPSPFPAPSPVPTPPEPVHPSPVPSPVPPNPPPSPPVPTPPPPFPPPPPPVPPPPAIVPGTTRVVPHASTRVPPDTSAGATTAGATPAGATAASATPPRPTIGTSTYHSGNYTELVTEPITGVVVSDGGPTEPIEMSGSLTGHLLSRNQEMYRRRERRRKLRAVLWVSFGLLLFAVGIAVVVNMLAGDFIRSIFDTFSDWAG